MCREKLQEVCRLGENFQLGSDRNPVTCHPKAWGLVNIVNKQCFLAAGNQFSLMDIRKSLMEIRGEGSKISEINEALGKCRL